MSLAVIIPAGGSSTRFGSNKLTALLGGRPVVLWTLEAFLPRDDVTRVIVSGPIELAIRHPKLMQCDGGGCRQESVRHALTLADQDWVAVHDAARPLVSQQLIDRVVAAAYRYGAAGPACAASVTIKQAVGPLPAPVDRTVPRQQLWAMQTPQVMRRVDLQHAFDVCPLPLEQVTDDLQLLELARLPSWLVEGDPGNIKLTHAVDVVVAEHYLRRGH